VTLALYFHTLRHLRPVQVAGRVRARLYRPRADFSPPPPRRPLALPYVAPVHRAPALLAPGTFRFLNVVRDVTAAADWHPSDASRLWIYNLHYFEDLNASDAPARGDWHRRLLERWVAENPPAPKEAWEPYPVSRRIVSWVKWAASGNSLPPACHASLAVQARWLAPRLEYRLLGNHLLANAKALVHAGLYFEGSEAQDWLARGLALLSGSLPSSCSRTADTSS
jgi:hypothetical protein